MDVAAWNQRIQAQQLQDEQALRTWLQKQGVTGYAQSLLVWERFGYPGFLQSSANELIDGQYADPAPLVVLAIHPRDREHVRHLPEEHDREEHPRFDRQRARGGRPPDHRRERAGHRSDDGRERRPPLALLATQATARCGPLERLRRFDAFRARRSLCRLRPSSARWIHRIHGSPWCRRPPCRGILTRRHLPFAFRVLPREATGAPYG